VVDIMAAELARLATVEELASVRCDLNTARSLDVGLLQVHATSAATAATAITDTHRRHLVVATDALQAAQAGADPEKGAL
jgi:hypothetical protein